MSDKKAKTIATVVFTVLAVLIAVFCALPFVYMVLMSFHESSNSIFTWPPKLFVKPRLKNYVEAFQYIGMGKLALNTLILMLGSVVIGIASSVLVAYGFARFQNRYSNFFFNVLLSTMMIPWVVTMIPAYAEFEMLGWLGTRLPLIVPWIGGSAFNIFLLKQFMTAVPKELDEAGKIDGCNSFVILVQIILPQLKPALATVFIFAFMNTWSDYLGPSIYLQDSSLYTLSLGMEGFFSATGTANWAWVMAAGVMFSLPLILLLFVCQKAFVRGIVTSGIK